MDETRRKTLERFLDHLRKEFSSAETDAIVLFCAICAVSKQSTCDDIPIDKGALSHLAICASTPGSEDLGNVWKNTHLLGILQGLLATVERSQEKNWLVPRGDGQWLLGELIVPSWLVTPPRSTIVTMSRKAMYPRKPRASRKGKGFRKKAG